VRICLVGHLTDQPDEGVRSIAAHLVRALRARHNVEFMSVYRPVTWSRIRRFRPHIIHFVLSPTGVGLLVAKALSLAHRRARTVISAPHPGNGIFSRWTTLFKPDVVLAQAADSEQKFRERGHRTLFLPNGVDTERFVTVGSKTKQRLRERYGIGDRFVVLHVGPLKRGRNVQMLGQLQGHDRQVLIVGRPSDPAEGEIVTALQEKGCVIWAGYFESIHEIYALSDCYVFPTNDRRSCIEMPLSVLEAMACNLPVVCTPFGALPRIADEGEGIIYAQTADEFEQALTEFESNSVTVSTRQKAMSLSWANIARQLEHIYEQLFWQS
jgi:glycosyltransferase involved in cell wall biosynthesis